MAVAEIEGSNDTTSSHDAINYKAEKPSFTLGRVMQVTTLGLLASSAAHGFAKISENEYKYLNTPLNYSSLSYPALTTQAQAADLKAQAYHYKISNYSYADKRYGVLKIVFTPIDTTTQTQVDRFLSHAIAYFKSLATYKYHQKHHHNLPALAIESSEVEAYHNITFSHSRVTGQVNMDCVVSEREHVTNYTVIDNDDLRIITADRLFIQETTIFNADAVLNSELSIQKTFIDLT